MKRQFFAIALLMGMLSVGALSACTPSRSSQAQPETGQSDGSQTAVANPIETGAPSPEERAQKRAAVLKQIKGVLAPEQDQQLQTKLQQGEKMRTALQGLDLQADQKTKIRDILKAAYPHRNRRTQQS